MSKISPLQIRDTLRLIILNMCALGLVVLLVHPSFEMGCPELIEPGGSGFGRGIAAVLAVLCLGITKYGVATVTTGFLVYADYRYFKSRKKT